MRHRAVAIWRANPPAQLSEWHCGSQQMGYPVEMKSRQQKSRRDFLQNR